MANKEKKIFEVYYNEELLFDGVCMTEIPYKIVQSHMALKESELTFSEFKDEFKEIKEIISKKGETQFILEANKIGDKNDTSNTRRSNYITRDRGLLTYNNDGETQFGVWTQWKYEDKKSNFSKFIDKIKLLGYSIVDKINNDETMGDHTEMSSIEYKKLRNVIQKIIENQNIRISDLGCTEEQFNNDKTICFDMALIKKLDGSNANDKADVSSHQASIMLTSEQIGIFPCIKRAKLDDKVVGRNIVMKLKVNIMNNNLLYLQGDKSYKSVQNKPIITYTTTNEATQERVELGCRSADGDEYVNLMKLSAAEDILVILKLKYKIEYVAIIIKKEDREEYFGDIKFDKYITYFDYINRVTANNKDEITYVESDKIVPKLDSVGINKIYFGAPGTGKSKHVENKYSDKYSKRVTFHPEYTYNDFVGYVRPVVDGDDLTYAFVPGIFTEILVEALSDPYNMYTLIIEELNRANTAAVFGDLFQLLDRVEDGSSEYRVNNTDIYKYIKDTMGEDYIHNDGSIGIPSNLNIIATMNTADQNVFVMDTAFKRRWEFEYIKVEFKDDHKFKDNAVTNIDITWKQFVEVINEFMMSEENKDLFISEDKQIGPYFVKENELNDPNKFGYKVLLYLWDDAFKMDKYKLFNKDIRTFSALISEFSKDDATNIFNPNFVKKLNEKKSEEIRVEEDKQDE